MQITIKRSELEAFKIQAQHIKPNTILPILSYIKIEVIGDFCTLTKSNNQAFIIRTIPIDCEDCCFLIDEIILYNFIDYSTDEDIVFTDYGNYRILISDSNNKSSKSPTEDAKGFPALEKEDAEWIPISKLALSSSGICSNIIMDGQIWSAQSFVFIGRGCVAGCDGNIGYLQDIKESLPDIILRKEVAICISKMTSCEYSQNKSYDFFKDNNTIFGFSKSEIKFFDMRQILKDVPAMSSFSINKNILIKFNSFCTSSKADKTLGATFKAIDNKLFLELVDEKIGFDAKSNILIPGCSGEFKYDPAVMNQLLKSLPCDECYFYPADNRYYITDIDRTFISAVMAKI